MEHLAGKEALVALSLILTARYGYASRTGRKIGRLEDGRKTGNTESGIRLDGMDAASLLAIVREATERLRGMGVDGLSEKLKSGCSGQMADGDSVPSYPTVEERLVVTKDYRLLLPLHGNAEIHLKPLCKVLFILFLKHPEGIDFKSIGLFEEEMYDIYSVISRRLDATGMRKSIRQLGDSVTNSLSAHKAILTRDLSRYLDGSNLALFKISGNKGGTRHIRIDRALVEWE